MSTHRPASLSIPDALYDEIAHVCGSPFAFSYFSKAVMTNGAVLPWTVVAWDRIRSNDAAKRVMAKLGFDLIRPQPFSPESHSPARFAA